MTGTADKLSARENKSCAEKIFTPEESGSVNNTDSTATPVVKETTSPATSATSSDGPIRDWSNPPGFKGYSNHADFKMKKHKGLNPNKKRHKYHPKKKGRCYSF